MQKEVVYLEERLSRRKGNNNETEEEPKSCGLFRTRIVVDLSDALNVDLVAKLLTVDAVTDDGLDDDDLKLALRIAASVLAQVLKMNNNIF